MTDVGATRSVGCLLVGLLTVGLGLVALLVLVDADTSDEPVKISPTQHALQICDAIRGDRALESSEPASVERVLQLVRGGGQDGSQWADLPSDLFAALCQFRDGASSEWYATDDAGRLQPIPEPG